MIDSSWIDYNLYSFPTALYSTYKLMGLPAWSQLGQEFLGLIHDQTQCPRPLLGLFPVHQALGQLGKDFDVCKTA